MTLLRQLFPNIEIAQEEGKTKIPVAITKGNQYFLERFALTHNLPLSSLTFALLDAAIQELQSVSRALEVWYQLSARDAEYVALICLGYSNRQIAETLTVSENTVKSQVRNLLSKFNAENKGHLAYMLRLMDFSALEQQLIEQNGHHFVTHPTGDPPTPPATPPTDPQADQLS